MKNSKIIIFVVLFFISFVSFHVMGATKDTTVIQYLIGNTPINFIIAMFISALVGFAGSVILDVLTRDISSIDTPELFNFSFWWSENKLRIGLVCLGLGLWIVVCAITGKDIDKGYCLGLGWMGDNIAEKFKRKFITPKVRSNAADKIESVDENLNK